MRPDHVDAEVSYRRKEVLTEQVKVQDILLVAAEHVDDDEMGESEDSRQRLIH